MQYFKLVIAATAMLSLTASPAFSKHGGGHGDNGHHDDNNGYHGRPEVQRQYQAQHHYQKQQQKIAKKQFHQQRKLQAQQFHDNHANDWNWQRTQYRNNWPRINATQQREMDAQMRAQWLAYHHNTWNGNYNWSNYSDPNFLDYLHTSNPSLLTRLRTYLSF